ncbi:Predicted dehydrogenase [Hymenobacter daecheongensis DSM 21074]|uniref:Predicted dehydrogenase n=1 Tax=Hymenobacter daecheongensis DSM 21074 TaxID=1121955 RepID=A0A1M6AUQ0_9BACT|nr:Gfo/Idh/MocA family oxidoreductase [Hymenobacter daecheongensis]SHI39943.1 Predicted dehydrogenase [Hymenobacter daecheongensis DSM 21074]
MHNRIPTGLLAYGMSGRVFHAPFLATHPGFALRAVVERSRQEARQTYPDLISYNSVAALLADPAIELVVVNTPNDTHAELTRMALRAGKHVLLEKPVATSVAEFEELWALARQMGRHLLAYQNRRWDSDFLAVRQVVESGQLGRLIEVNFRFDRYKPALNVKAFKETPVPGSGLLYDLGPHLLDQVISLFGRPLRSYKTTGRYRPGSQVDDYFSYHLQYPEGLNVFVTSGLLIAQPLPAFVLHGTRGSFVKARADVQEAQLLAGISPLAPDYGREARELAGSLTLAGADGPTTTAYPASKGDYGGLFEAVYQTIRHGAAYPIREAELRWQNELLAQAPGLRVF